MSLDITTSWGVEVLRSCKMPYLDTPQNSSGFEACPNMAPCNSSMPHESDMVVSQLRALETHTPILVFCYLCMRELRLWNLTCIFYENVPVETFNILFESTQNKQQYGTNITYKEGKCGEVCGLEVGGWP